MKIWNVILCVLLAICMSLSIVGCANNNGNEAETKNTKNNEIEEDTEVVTDEEAILYQPVEKKYDREYRMLTITNGAETNYWESASDTITGVVVNDALFIRSALMEEKFGVDMVIDVDSNASSTLSTRLTSGDFVCDVSCIKAVDTFNLIKKGYYEDISDYSQLNLEASYWDQRIQSEYAINNKKFLLEGDFSIYDELRTYVILYNDGLYTDYGLYDTYGSLYNLVNSEKWTLEVLTNMCKNMYFDINNNEVRDESDQYGIIGELTMVYYMFLGSGYKTIANNNGNISLLIKDQTYFQMIYDVIENTMQLAVNDDVLMPQLLACDDVWTAASKAFENNQALFRSTSLSASLRLGEMEQRFGILPIPAYEENQGGYYCWVSGNTHTPLGIPQTTHNIEETLAITEALCYYSRYGTKSLYEAFFESFRIAKLCKTEEDKNMLDLIFKSKTYDFDQTVKITGIESAIYSLAKQKELSTLLSTITTLKDASQAQLNDFLLNIAKQ